MKIDEFAWKQGKKGADKKGHSDIVSFRLSPQDAEKAGEVVQRGPFGFRTRGDLLRDCYYHRMDEYAQLMQTPGFKCDDIKLDNLVANAKFYHEASQVADLIDDLKAELNTCIRLGVPQKGVELIKEVEQGLAKRPDTWVKDAAIRAINGVKAQLFSL